MKYIQAIAEIITIFVGIGVLWLTARLLVLLHSI
jgi:hypothetical protein